jgi:hypothetical protein
MTNAEPAREGSDEVEEFVRSRRKRRITISAVMLVVVLGLGVTWLLTRPSPCEQLVDDICGYAEDRSIRIANCQDMLEGFRKVGVSEDECSEARTTLRAALADAPPQTHPHIYARVMFELMNQHIDASALVEAARDSTAHE